MADKAQGKKIPTSRKLSIKKILDITKTLSAKTEEQIFRDVREEVEKTWAKPLCLEDDQYRGMWMAVQEDVRISCLCKDLFDKLLEAFRNEKGTDRLPKLLSKWIVLTADVINGDHELTQRVLHLCLSSSENKNTVATAFSGKLTSCLVSAVKEVFWKLVYDIKRSEDESNTVEQSQNVHELSATEDLVSMYRLGSYALFRIKKIAWKKIKFSPHKKLKKLLVRRLDVVEALEEKDKSKIPPELQYQNRNLLIMKHQLLPIIQEFLKAFRAIVNFKGYQTYGKNIFKVAESQVLCNLEVKDKFFESVVEVGVNESKAILNPLFKDFMQKIFNTRCKAFLKSIEILEEDKQRKSLQRDTLLRAKLKVIGADKKKEKKKAKK